MKKRKKEPTLTEIKALAKAMFHWSLVSIGAYRHPESSDYRDTLEEAAQEFESAMARVSPWIRDLFESL